MQTGRLSPSRCVKCPGKKFSRISIELFSYMKVFNIIGLDYSNWITAELELAQTEKIVLFDPAGNLFCIWVLTAESIETLGVWKHIK